MAQIDSLPPLREVIAKHGLGALKALGQNFLLDLNLTSRIARAGGSLEGETVVEVGPGPGGLTRAILAAGVKRLVVVERDRRAIPALQEISEAYPGKLVIVEGDALKEDLAALAGGPARIIANLPYNIATPLLIGWLKTDPWPPWWTSATLMFQKEVAERIVATPEDNAFGRLGVLANWKTEPRILFEVSPKAFVPPPKVTSAIVHLVPRAKPEPCDPDILERAVAAAFGQRRKMLRSSLKSMVKAPEEWLERAGIDPTARAETIDVAGFVRLANAYEPA